MNPLFVKTKTENLHPAGSPFVSSIH